jgi:hypothetical protein
VRCTEKMELCTTIVRCKSGETRANRGLNKTPGVITRARQAAAAAVSSERGCGASIPAGERSRVVRGGGGESSKCTAASHLSQISAHALVRNTHIFFSEATE